MAFFEIGKHLAYRAFLSIGRREVNGIEKFACELITVFYRERNLCIVLRPLARTRDLNCKYLLECEALTSRFGVRFLFGFVYGNERGGEVRKVVTRPHVVWYRIFYLREDVTRKDTFERMVKPSARYTPAFRIY